MNGVYTIQSDIWGLAVLFWEVFTYGQIPYSTMSNTQVYDQIQNPRMRLEKPRLQPPELYALSEMCWASLLSSRPTHSVIINQIKRLMCVGSGSKPLSSAPRIPRLSSSSPAKYDQLTNDVGKARTVRTFPLRQTHDIGQVISKRCPNCTVDHICIYSISYA